MERTFKIPLFWGFYHEETKEPWVVIYTLKKPQLLLKRKLWKKRKIVKEIMACPQDEYYPDIKYHVSENSNSETCFLYKVK